ncbi:MAG: NAD(P)H-dependent glycerol-3-phosphate dehydrogenase [Verrucomicrobia bacterium]|nr:NAD(P)H-dependent glycerol-3-phosphate dehydrogenase [Verrucomicrobiota bacterium]
MSFRKVTILGSGAWAFALSQALKGVEVAMYSIEKEVIDSIRQHNKHPRFPIVAIQTKIDIHEELYHAIKDSDLLIESVTSQGFKPVIQALKELNCKTPILITSKGINDQGKTLFETALEMGLKDLAVLSGATFADEVLAKMTTCATIASLDLDLAKKISAVFNQDFFHTENSKEPIACMLGGAMKNIYAILCGLLEGLGYGKNARAALITKAYQEMKQLLHFKGIHSLSLEGYSGLADLILTCSSEKSRNFQCGLNIAHGMSCEDARGSVGMVVEGAFAAKAIYQVIRLPIAEIVYNILYEGYSVDQQVRKIF